MVGGVDIPARDVVKRDHKPTSVAHVHRIKPAHRLQSCGIQ